MKHIWWMDTDGKLGWIFQQRSQGEWKQSPGCHLLLYSLLPPLHSPHTGGTSAPMSSPQLLTHSRWMPPLPWRRSGCQARPPCSLSSPPHIIISTSTLQVCSFNSMQQAFAEHLRCARQQCTEMTWLWSPLPELRTSGSQHQDGQFTHRDDGGSGDMSRAHQHRECWWTSGEVQEVGVRKVGGPQEVSSAEGRGHLPSMLHLSFLREAVQPVPFLSFQESVSQAIWSKEPVSYF